MRVLVILASVASAFAQLTINTPLGVLACTNQVVTWSGGTAPYIFSVQPGGDVSAAALETFTGLSGTSYSWHVIEAANTQVFLRLHDSTGLTAETATFTIQSAGVTCTASNSTTTAAGAVTTPVDTTTGAAATTPAAGGTTTTPAAGGSSSSTTSHTSTSTTKTGGATAIKVAGGLAGLLGAVAVAVM